MKKILAILLSVLMAFSAMVFTAGAAGTDVAAIGSATYATLSEALEVSAAGDTITLIDNVTEDVTIDKNITIDGAGKQYTGTISVAGGKTVVIQNVNFVSGRVEANTKNTKNNLTVRNCTFEGSMTSYAIIINSGSNLIIEDCKAKDIGQGLAYAKNSVSNIVLRNVELDGATYGLNMVNNTTTTFENVTMTNVTRGLQFQTNSTKTITFNNCKISVIDAENAAPVYISHKADTTQNLIFEGENDFGTDDLTFGSSLVKVTADVAKVNGKVYETLQQAIDACEKGDNTITLLYNCDETVTIKQQEGINIVLDGNGRTYTGTINVDGNHRATGAETLTIKNVKFEKIASNYARFISAEENGKGGNSEAHNLTVDSCSFKSNNWHYAIYTRNPYNLTVKNCTAETVYYFIYNPQGGHKMTVENCKVTKATYGIGSQKCTDVSINDYTYTGKAAGIYGRATSNDASITMENVDITTTLNGQSAITLWKNNDGTTSKEFKFIFKGENKISAPEGVDWFAIQQEANSPYSIYPACYNTTGNELTITHIPGVAATCMNNQECTACGFELDAVKDHQLSEYVSNDDATCKKDGTKTAKCIYGCGLEDTITDEGTIREHTDADGDKHCEYCKGEFCDICDGLHYNALSNWFCILTAFLRLLVSFLTSIA